MKPWYGFILLVLTAQFCFGQKKADEMNTSVHVFDVRVNEYVEVGINLEYNTDGNPTFYSSHLETDVCSDGLCKPISITIHWDLLGNFRSYYTDANNALTKFDHVELTKADHEKLHEILSDTSSILRDYNVEDMIDTTTKLQSHKLDAITGATSKTFDGATVEGALYTVYTLWHFTNGDVRKKILHHTESLVNDSFVNYMLHSNDRDYTSFIFKNMNEEQINKFLPDILELVGNKDDYIPHFALAHLDEASLSNSNIQHRLIGYISKVSSHVQNALLDKLSNAKLDMKSLEFLMNSLHDIHGLQITKAFSLLDNNKSSLNNNLINQLKGLSKSEVKEISRGAKSLLNKVNH